MRLLSDVERLMAARMMVAEAKREEVAEDDEGRSVGGGLHVLVRRPVRARHSTVPFAAETVVVL